MVKRKRDKLSRVFNALADPTRRKILLRIAKEGCCVTDIAKPFKMSLPAVSKHLKVLEQAGLLTRTREGKMFRCAIDAQPLNKAGRTIQLFERYWTNQLDALEKYLNQQGG
jgi:DNA-binding transcriptional ArsR family regulator